MKIKKKLNLNAFLAGLLTTCRHNGDCQTARNPSKTALPTWKEIQNSSARNTKLTADYGVPLGQRHKRRGGWSWGMNRTSVNLEVNTKEFKKQTLVFDFDRDDFCKFFCYNYFSLCPHQECLESTWKGWKYVKELILSFYYGAFCKRHIFYFQIFINNIFDSPIINISD